MQKEKSRADDGGILGGCRSADSVHTTLTPVRGRTGRADLGGGRMATAVIRAIST